MGRISTKAKNLYKIVDNNYITKVGNTLSKTAEEINITTTEKGIDLFSNTSIEMKAENETVLGEYVGPEVVEDKFIEVESGKVEKGHKIIEDGNIVITNSKFERGYDWFYADNPSESTMRLNNMSSFDIFNINFLKKHPDFILKTRVKTSLWLSSDVGAGFGENGLNLANHFFTGGGKDFTFTSDSNPSNEIKNSSEFSVFLNSLKEELKNKYLTNNYINKSKSDDKPYKFSSKLPYYPVSDVIYPSLNEVAAFIGGIQGSEVKYRVLENKATDEVKIEIDRVIFLDTFGAGWEDGGAGGWKKQYVPGLLEMFVLQHFKNLKNKNKYRPFTIKLHINF